MAAKFAVVALGAAAALATIAPAQAGTVITFGNYKQTGSASDMVWTKSTGTLSTTPVSAPVSFSLYATPFTSALSNLAATLTLTASTTGSSVLGTFAGQVIETGLVGTFEFKSVGAFTYNSVNYAAGTKLLEADLFGGATLEGGIKGTSGSFHDSTGLGSIIYSSDLISKFGPNRDFSIDLTAANVKFGPTLASFKSHSGGNFSADAVPEPATWGLMIAGFGMLGLVARRQRRMGALAA